MGQKHRMKLLLLAAPPWPLSNAPPSTAQALLPGYSPEPLQQNTRPWVLPSFPVQ